MFISTNELEKIHQDDSVLIVDARSYKDYSNGHIPGSVSLGFILISLGRYFSKRISEFW